VSGALNFSGFMIWNGPALVKAKRDELEMRMRRAGERAVAMAKRLAPVDTGRLKRGIVYHYNQARNELLIVSDSPYGIFQEYGTVHFKAHPHIRPALVCLDREFPGLNIGAAFYHATELKSSVATPRTAAHHYHQAYNRAYSARFNRGGAGRARSYIRSQRGDYEGA